MFALQISLLVDICHRQLLTTQRKKISQNIQCTVHNRRFIFLLCFCFSDILIWNSFISILDTLPPGPIQNESSDFDHNNFLLKWTAPINNTLVTLYEVTISGIIKNTTDNKAEISFSNVLVPGRYYQVKIVTVSGTENAKRSTPYSRWIRVTPISKGDLHSFECIFDYKYARLCIFSSLILIT